MVTKELNEKYTYLKGEKSSYDRQFVRCGVSKKNIPKVGQPDNTNTITDSHTNYRYRMKSNPLGIST